MVNIHHTADEKKILKIVERAEMWKINHGSLENSKRIFALGTSVQMKISLRAQKRGNAAKNLGEDLIAKIFFDKAEELRKIEKSAESKKAVK